MNFLFWNIKKKTNDDFLDYIVKILNENDTDIFMVAELPVQDIERVKNFIIDNANNNYKHINGYVFEKVIIFAKNDIDIQFYDYSNQGKRIAAFTIYSKLLNKQIILFTIHFYDKYTINEYEQNERINRVREYIDGVENRLGNDEFSIVCGDFNLNPHEIPMIKATGMHAVMDRRIALKGKRKVQGEDYSFFYNPMWGLWGDTGKGDAPGTFFMSASGNDVVFFWNILDQVLLRKGLINYFDNDKLNIITKINGENLLKENGSINSEKFSDHLPITFCLNI